jgi:hypothetical protein
MMHKVPHICECVIQRSGSDSDDIRLALVKYDSLAGKNETIFASGDVRHSMLDQPL